MRRISGLLMAMGDQCGIIIVIVAQQALHHSLGMSAIGYEEHRWESIVARRLSHGLRCVGEIKLVKLFFVCVLFFSWLLCFCFVVIG